MPELALCRCARYAPFRYPSWTCHAFATQEDFLCDDCRKGCRIAIEEHEHRWHPYLDENHCIGFTVKGQELPDLMQQQLSNEWVDYAVRLQEAGHDPYFPADPA